MRENDATVGELVPESEARSLKRLDAVFDSVDFAIVLTDLDGRVTDWNAGAENLLGWNSDEVIGETADRFFKPEE